MSKIGLITIGQSPRDDVTRDLFSITGKGVEFVEKGALDGITMDEIENLKPEKEDFPLITRLRDGSSVVVGKRKIAPLIQSMIEEMENLRVKACALLCTEEFEVKSNILFLIPSKLIFNLITSLLSKGNLFVFVPMKEQMENAKRKWERTGLNVSVEVLNPYSSSQNIDKVKERVKGDLIVFDCIGYSLDLKSRIQEITGKPAILPRSILGMTIKEIL
jgi:protein AroM